jgi:DNA-binding IclR family transcriptional regulator
MAASADAASKHRIPVIDRMMDVLAELERRTAGASIRELVTALGLPRTTIYRILNTLQLHDMVHRTDAGAYLLGKRLRSLAAHVPAGVGTIDLAALAQPLIEQLAARLGEGAKLTVLEPNDTLVIAAANGKREYALSVTAGQRLTPHSGAAGKLLLAYLPDAERRAWLVRPMTAFTPRTITDPKKLAAELSRIRKQGWAIDKGEGVPSVLAYAAPVFDTRDKMVAAVSVPFLAGTEAEHMEEIRLAVLATAAELTASITGPVAD